MSLFWIIIFVFFALVSFILAFVFFIKRGEANKIFGFILLLFSANLIFNVSYWESFLTSNMRYFILTIYYYLIPLSLYGALFYLYLRTVIEEKTLRSQDLWHFLPFAITIISYGGVYFMPPSIKLSIANSGRIKDYFFYFEYFEECLLLILIIYVSIIHIKYKSTYKDKPNLNTWLHIISKGFIGFTLAYMTYVFLAHLGWLEFEYDYIISLCMSLLIILSAYFAFWRKEIFEGKPISELIPFTKYQTSPLSSEFEKDIARKLEVTMLADKPFLNPDLRLEDLADSVGITRNQMSQIINSKFKRNFNDYINDYRLAEAEKLLKNEDSTDLSIKEIIYRSGFNNRTTFFKCFKEKFGMTPLQYRREDY